MDREQIINKLRNLQDSECTKFGDMADHILGNAANLLEQDDLDIQALEHHSGRTIEQSNKNCGCLIILFFIVYMVTVVGVISYYKFAH